MLCGGGNDLPAGLSINPATGAITGTPTTIGTTTVTISAVNVDGLDGHWSAFDVVLSTCTEYSCACVRVCVCTRVCMQRMTLCDWLGSCAVIGGDGSRVGMALAGIGVAPEHNPVSVSFVDTNTVLGEYGGTVTIVRPASEVDIVSYKYGSDL